MKAELEMWRALVTEVLITSDDIATVARRLHQGHDSIFVRKESPSLEHFGLQAEETHQDDSDSKKIISMLEQILEALKHEKD